MPVHVLVQKGHHAPREPGHETETGASGEQHVVDLIGNALRSRLDRDPRFECKLIPGEIPNVVKSGEWRVDAFISLHCDGSTDPNRRGWGVGYPDGAVNKELAGLIAEEFLEFHPSERMPDNYTRNMSGYYGWGKVPTPGPEVLVEHDFSSSPAGREWMIENADRLAGAEYRAILRYFNLPEQKAGPTLFVAPWVEPFLRWYTGERIPANRPPGAPLVIHESVWALVRVIEDDRRKRDTSPELAALRQKINTARTDLEGVVGRLAL